MVVLVVLKLKVPHHLLWGPLDPHGCLCIKSLVLAQLTFESVLFAFLDLRFGLLGSLPSSRDHGFGVNKEECIGILGFVEGGILEGGKT